MRIGYSDDLPKDKRQLLKEINIMHKKISVLTIRTKVDMANGQATPCLGIDGGSLKSIQVPKCNELISAQGHRLS